MSKPLAVGMHIYSGAFTVGVSRYFDIAGQWEEGPWGAATFELNFPGVPHPLERADWPTSEARGRTVLMYANPPCAPWSTVGSRLGMADPRVAYTDNVVRAALDVEPDFFVWESVCQALTKGRPKVDEVAGLFGKAGYAVTVLLTNGVLHGAPQFRNRFHLIAHRYSLRLEEPRVGREDVATVRQAIADIADTAVPEGAAELLSNHVFERYDERSVNVVARLHEGEGWEHGYARALEAGLPARKARFIAHRLYYDAPCGTIADVGALVHPARDRGITVREAARLCGYPDSFRFADKEKPKYEGDVRRQDVTQAVLPPVGEFLARTFTRALDVGDEATPGAFEVVDWRPLAKWFSPKRFTQGYIST